VTSYVADMLHKIGIPYVELRGRQVGTQEGGHPVRAVRIFDTATHAGFDSTGAAAGESAGPAGPAGGNGVAMALDHPYPASRALDVAAHGGRVEGRYDPRTKILHLHLLDRNEVYAAKVEVR
jgi:hypothetical protein